MALLDRAFYVPSYWHFGLVFVVCFSMLFFVAVVTVEIDFLFSLLIDNVPVTLLFTSYSVPDSSAKRFDSCYWW